MFQPKSNKIPLVYFYILFLLPILMGCKGRNMQNEDKVKPHWQPVVSTPADFPVTVFDGILTYPTSGGESIMRASLVNNAWGSEGGSFTTLRASSAPDGVGIKWYSFIDDKFYQGFFDLPYDTIKALFDKGFISSYNKRPDNYKYIVVGLAPGGIVSVWVAGEGIETEVGNFRAKEVDLNLIEEIPAGMRDYYDGFSKDSARLEWRESILDDIPEAKAFVESGKPIPQGLWDKKYRERFDSRVAVHFADSLAIIDMMTMRYINGEQESLMFEAMKENTFKKRPRFTEVVFNWSFGRELSESTIRLDEHEIVDAYAKIYQDQPRDMQVEFRVDVNKANDHIRVYLQAVGTEYPREVELEKSYIQIYPIDDAYRFRYDVFKDEYEYIGGGIPRRKDRIK